MGLMSFFNKKEKNNANNNSQNLNSVDFSDENILFIKNLPFPVKDVSPTIENMEKYKKYYVDYNTTVSMLKMGIRPNSTLFELGEKVSILKLSLQCKNLMASDYQARKKCLLLLLLLEDLRFYFISVKDRKNLYEYYEKIEKGIKCNRPSLDSVHFACTYGHIIDVIGTDIIKFAEGVALEKHYKNLTLTRAELFFSQKQIISEIAISQNLIQFDSVRKGLILAGKKYRAEKYNTHYSPHDDIESSNSLLNKASLNYSSKLIRNPSTISSESIYAEIPSRRSSISSNTSKESGYISSSSIEPIYAEIKKKKIKPIFPINRSTYLDKILNAQNEISSRKKMEENTIKEILNCSPLYTKHTLISSNEDDLKNDSNTISDITISISHIRQQPKSNTYRFVFNPITKKIRIGYDDIYQKIWNGNVKKIFSAASYAKLNEYNDTSMFGCVFYDKEKGKFTKIESNSDYNKTDYYIFLSRLFFQCQFSYCDESLKITKEELKEFDRMNGLSSKSNEIYI